MTAPRTTEHHPAGYAYHDRFPRSEVHHEGEGGTVYVADDGAGYYAISDESLLVDLLGEDLDAITIRAFDTREARDAYCAAHYTRHPAPADGPAADAG